MPVRPGDTDHVDWGLASAKAVLMSAQPVFKVPMCGTYAAGDWREADTYLVNDALVLDGVDMRVTLTGTCVPVACQDIQEPLGWDLTRFLPETALEA